MDDVLTWGFLDGDKGHSDPSLFAPSPSGGQYIITSQFYEAWGADVWHLRVEDRYGACVIVSPWRTLGSAIAEAQRLYDQHTRLAGVATNTLAACKSRYFAGKGQ